MVGTGATGLALPGRRSVSVSADGNTAVVGAPGDNSSFGASWVFTRSGAVWTQQGLKLVGSDAVGTVAHQGDSIALSADGNTFIVGGTGDNSNIGAAWVFTRSGGVWSQQGGKLVGSGAEGRALSKAVSVSISADGNTAIVGGTGDNVGAGAAWVWTRSGGVWSQQGDKLVGSGAAGDSGQGISVALSGDGNTAIVGGSRDNSFIGAAWVWTRSGGVWTQQGAKLVGTGAEVVSFFQGPLQGSSVALSFDGNTAMVGGFGDNTIGATWVFTGAEASGPSKAPSWSAPAGWQCSGQGHAVSLSSDGNKAIIGGYTDNGFAGAAWMWSEERKRLDAAGQQAGRHRRCGHPVETRHLRVALRRRLHGRGRRPYRRQ